MKFRELKPALPVGRYYEVSVDNGDSSYVIHQVKQIDIGSTHLQLKMPKGAIRLVDLVGADIHIDVV